MQGYYRKRKPFKRENEIPANFEKLVDVLNKKQRITEQLEIKTKSSDLSLQKEFIFDGFEFQNDSLKQLLQNVNFFHLNVEESKKEETNDDQIDAINQMSQQDILIKEAELNNKKVSELRELVQNISSEQKKKFHWTWLQLKTDLIQLIIDPINPKFCTKK